MLDTLLFLASILAAYYALDYIIFPRPPKPIDNPNDIQL